MKFLKAISIIFITLIIAVPMFLNSFNIIVNRNDISSFKVLLDKRGIKSWQTRPKDIFFLDGRFKGFNTERKRFKDSIFYEVTLECDYNPKNTLFRLRMFQKDNDDSYPVIADISFSGELKDMILNEGLFEYMLMNVTGVYREGVYDIEILNELLKNKDDFK